MTTTTSADTPDSRPLVLYHAHCTDGQAAAFAAWCRFGTQGEYVAVQYGKDDTIEALRTKYPDIEQRRVYVLDFSYAQHVMEWLSAAAKRLVWLDHHASSKPTAVAMAGFALIEPRTRIECEQPTWKLVHDNDKSGAMLAWEFFHPEKDVPRLIQRIDDRDRWVFQYDDSRALHAGLALRKPWKFTDWLTLVPMGGADWHRGYNDVVSMGRAAMAVYEEQTRGAVERARPCSIVLDCWHEEEVPGFTRADGYDRLYGGLAVNSPVLQSEIGHELANASGTYGLVWYYDGTTGRANCSLRSNGDYDVSAIAKRFGGGGHKNAAGFNIDMPTLLGWINTGE